MLLLWCCSAIKLIISYYQNIWRRNCAVAQAWSANTNTLKLVNLEFPTPSHKVWHSLTMCFIIDVGISIQFTLSLVWAAFKATSILVDYIRISSVAYFSPTKGAMWSQGWKRTLHYAFRKIDAKWMPIHHRQSNHFMVQIQLRRRWLASSPPPPLQIQEAARLDGLWMVLACFGSISLGFGMLWRHFPAQVVHSAFTHHSETLRPFGLPCPLEVRTPRPDFSLCLRLPMSRTGKRNLQKCAISTLYSNYLYQFQLNTLISKQFGTKHAENIEHSQQKPCKRWHAESTVFNFDQEKSHGMSTMVRYCQLSQCAIVYCLNMRRPSPLFLLVQNGSRMFCVTRKFLQT